MSHHPLIPAKPTEITIDTLPQLFAHHRAQFGGFSMTVGAPENEPPANPPAAPPAPPAAPERPDGVTEDEWNALSAPGKAALTREREARHAAERALAASRARPAPPKAPATPPAAPAAPPREDTDKPGGQPDIAAIVQQAVAAAIKPFTDREEQKATMDAAEKVRDAVLEAAKPLLHDSTDALASIDLTTVVNEQGQADPVKVKTALTDLVTRKPHLAKSQQRIAPPGIGGGAPAGATDAEKVKAVLADMQRATGVRPPASTTSITN